jgi:DNA replication protein DnaC
VEVKTRNRDYVASEDISKYARDISTFLVDKNHRQGLLFLGLPGNGKTTMLLAMQNATNLLIWSCQLKGWEGIRIVHALDVVRAALSKDGERLQGLIKEPLLAIDDVGTEPVDVSNYGNIVNPVTELIERRYENQLFTVISTNLQSSEIRPRYGSRVADRFNEMFHRVVFENCSFRK